jgi:hypothetical protein
MGGQIVVCEEAAFMDTKVFYEVVCPLLEMDKAALLCISTVESTANFYSVLTDLKDDKGEDVFNVLKFDLICEKCALLEDVKKKMQCTHKYQELPPWQSENKHSRLKFLMASQPELYLRETKGILSEGSNNPFKMGWVKRMIDNPRTVPTGTVSHVFIGIDPNGGGASKFGIVSGYFHQGRLVVRIR